MLSLWLERLSDNKLKTPLAIQLCVNLKIALASRRTQYTCSFVYQAMVLDPRYSCDETFLTAKEWKKAKFDVVAYIINLDADSIHDERMDLSADSINLNDSDDHIADPKKTLEHLTDMDDDDNSSGSSITNPWQLVPQKTTDPKAADAMAKKDLIEAEFRYLRAHVHQALDPFDFYMKEKTSLPNLSLAASHFLLASSSSVDSERFFSGATALYQNKSRNRLSAERAEKLLFVKGVDKSQASAAEKEDEESEEEAEPEIFYDYS